jgi:hypothetical protein
MDPQAKEIETLEAKLASETENLLTLKQSIEKDKQERSSIKKATFNNEREAKFYQENIKRIDVEEIQSKLRELNVDQLNAKREQVKVLKKALKEFEGIEPTNEALRRKIEDLQKSRLSLDMSFDDIL